MKSFQFCMLLMSLTTKEEISYFLQLYRETDCQGINKKIAEEILMEEFQKRVNFYEDAVNQQL